MDNYKNFMAGMAENRIAVLKDEEELDFLKSGDDLEALVIAAEEKVDELEHALCKEIHFWEDMLERCKSE